MNEDPSPSWFARHIDLIYRLVLLALIGLWVAFPPHASQPASQAAVVVEARR
jgi:hypothetical protein